MKEEQLAKISPKPIANGQVSAKSPAAKPSAPGKQGAAKSITTLAVDVGGTGIKAAALDEKGKMITERQSMGQQLQLILDAKTNPWGITIQSVEIRDVRIPQALENAMSQQAQAERERQARLILGDAETQVSIKFAEAARIYGDNPGALHLRAMNMLYEAMKEKGAMVIVPSTAVETMGLGGTLATAVMGRER